MESQVRVSLFETVFSTTPNSSLNFFSHMLDQGSPTPSHGLALGPPGIKPCKRVKPHSHRHGIQATCKTTSPWSTEKLPSMEPVPGPQKVGCC